jgi:Holliday junction DNA helicase RuvA
MIASLDGIVAAIGGDSLVLEVGGVGYRVYTAPSLLAAVAIGQRLRINTHHLVREDQQALYGFATIEELGFFELLLTVTGIGPKVALSIVGSRPPADLQLAILAGDHALLTTIPGVGRKLAERIVFELREKVAAAGAASAIGGGGDGDVVAALVALGYTQAEAREAWRPAAADIPADASLEDRVKAALRSLAHD